MSAFREPGFKERQEAAAKAKQAALDRLRARQKPVEPAVVQQAGRVSGAKAGSGAKKGRATEKAEKQAPGKAASKTARKAPKK